MNDKFEMTTGQAHEVAMAFGRNGWTNEEVKRFSEGTFLAEVRRVLLGHAAITAVEHSIDNNLIVRLANADRSRTPEQVLAATGRRQYVSDDVVATMPRGKGAKVETVFFKLDLSKRGGYISDDDLDKEFELRNLEPEYPDSLAAVNEADPAFADEHPNCTHWKDAKGNWCYAAFSRSHDGKRGVYVYRRDNYWLDYWWFAGRRK